MATPRSVSDVELAGVKTQPDKFNPCITDTFMDVPSAEIVVVPWKVFQIFPEIMHPNFRSEDGQITYDGDVNIFMSDINLQPSKYGHLEDFTQTWVIPVTSTEELGTITLRLSSYPSLLSVTLTARNILEDSVEIPMVIFLSPESQCIRDLVSKLGHAKESFIAGKKFSVEVDIGPSMVKWGKQVLRREFLSVGGRFVITSGAVFNHVFDWTNVMGCVPCLPCGIIGSSAYRLHRKINYKDEILSDIVGIAILGAKGMAFSNQRHAVYLLMQWIQVFKLYYCIDCRRKIPLNESQKAMSYFCKCEHRPESASTLARRNKMLHQTVSDKEGNTTEAASKGEESQCGSVLPSYGDSPDIEIENIDNDSEGNPKQDQSGCEFQPTSQSNMVDSGKGQNKGQDQTITKTNGSPRHKSHTAKSKGQITEMKRDEKVLDEKDLKFAPYKAGIAGTAIERKKWMVTQNPSVDKVEWKSSMDILKSKKPGGFVPMRTMFRYPAQRKKKPGRRPKVSGFVEIELKSAGNSGPDLDRIQEDAETSEITLPDEEVKLDKHGYIDGDAEEGGFYFSEEENNDQFDDDPLGRMDLKHFLMQISDPKMGTHNPAFSGGSDRPVTDQPGKSSESIV